MQRHVGRCSAHWPRCKSDFFPSWKETTAIREKVYPSRIVLPFRKHRSRFTVSNIEQVGPPFIMSFTAYRPSSLRQASWSASTNGQKICWEIRSLCWKDWTMPKAMKSRILLTTKFAQVSARLIEVTQNIIRESCAVQGLPKQPLLLLRQTFWGTSWFELGLLVKDPQNMDDLKLWLLRLEAN